MSKPKKRINIRTLVGKYGYPGAKRKLRIMGFSKHEVFAMTNFLFK